MVNSDGIIDLQDNQYCRLPQPETAEFLAHINLYLFKDFIASIVTI